MAQVVSDSFKKKLDEVVSSFELKVYIQDNSEKWIDFSSRIDNVGKNSLLKLGRISHTSEKGLYGFHTSMQSLVLDNSDGFWNKPFESLKTVDGSNASFTTSENGQRSIVYRHKVKLALQLLLHDGSIEEGTLGVFLIDETVWNNDGTVTLKLMGLAKPLMDRDASKVKGGRSWYVNRPIWFLVKELLKTEFADSSGELPDDFVLPGVVTIDTANGVGAVSHFGRPPEWDGSIWRNDGLFTRAICAAQVSGDSKAYVYLGCDNQLWRYDKDIDTYTQCGSGLTANYYIRRLWFNSNDNYLYGVAYQYPSSSSRITTLKIFRWNGSTLTTFTPTDADGSLSKCFPGDFCYREGTYDVGDVMRRIGNTSWGADGENVTMPYRQYVDCINSAVTDKTVGDTDLSSIFQNDTGTRSNLPQSVNPRVYKTVIGAMTGADPGPIGFRFTLNQQGCFAFDSNQNVIVYCVWDSTNNYQIYKYVISTNTCTKITGYPNSSYQPLCMDSDGGDYLWIGMIEWKDTSSNQSMPKIYKVQISTNSWSDRSGFASNYWTPIEICSCLSFVWADHFVVEFDREKMTYKLMRRYNTAWHLVYESKYQPTGLVVDSTTETLYFVEANSGRVAYWTYASGVVMGDNGNPFVEGDEFILSKLTIDDSDSNNVVVYGISAPYILPESQQSYPEGKYYLWQFSKKRSDRIELADFENLTVWKALLLLAQVADYIMGFDVNGNFYFVKRSELESSATLELGQSVDDDRLVSLSHSSGEKEVYNFCQLTPSVVRLQDLKAELKIVDRPDNYYGDGIKSLPFAPFTVDQRDLLTKRVKAICTQRGTVSDGKSRFKFLVYDSVIEANFKSAVGAADVTLYLYSVYGGNDLPQGIHTGDFIVVTDLDTGADIVKPVTGVTPSNNTVTIPSGGLGKAFKENDECRFIRSNYIDTSYMRSGWSDEGVTFLKVAANGNLLLVESIQELSIGMIIRVGTDDRRIIAIDPDYSPFPLVTVDVAFSINWSMGSIVYAWWTPETDGKFYEIGGINVFVKFELPSSGTAETDWTREFIEGDIISVVCPGLKLDKDEHSKVSAYASDSVAKFKKRQYPSINNRFIGRGLGKDICQRVVLRYKDPAFLIKAESVFLPYVAFVKQDGKLTAVDVISDVMFPFAEDFTVRGRVRRIDHDPLNCKTTFTLKAAETY